MRNSPARSIIFPKLKLIFLSIGRALLRLAGLALELVELKDWRRAEAAANLGPRIFTPEVVQYKAERARRQVALAMGITWLEAVCREHWIELSPREQQVARLAACGKNNAQIAAELGIHAVTVRNHRLHAMYKMHLRSQEAMLQMIGQWEFGSAEDEADHPGGPG